jgi:hypothetical protein
MAQKSSVKFSLVSIYSDYPAVFISELRHFLVVNGAEIRRHISEVPFSLCRYVITACRKFKNGYGWAVMELTLYQISLK